MNSKAPYALLDWDNTLRMGFTIISWTKYLCDNKAIPDNTYQKLLKQFDLYYAKEISYERLATSTTEVYAQALTGVKLSLIEELARSFSQTDTDVFPFTGKLLELFREKEIDAIIISGSPKIVLLQYAKRFGFSEIYGMDIELVDGKYTGKIKQDFGADKNRIVQEICHNRNGMPLIAFGDSSSDKPLLFAAKHGYLLDWKKSTIVLNGQEIAPISSIDSVIENLSFAPVE